jgi:hypothetical protein
MRVQAESLTALHTSAACKGANRSGDGGPLSRDDAIADPSTRRRPLERYRGTTRALLACGASRQAQHFDSAAYRGKAVEIAEPERIDTVESLEDPVPREPAEPAEPSPAEEPIEPESARAP